MFSDNFSWLIRQGNLQFEQFVCTLRIGRCNQTPEIGVNLQDGIDEELKKNRSLGMKGCNVKSKGRSLVHQRILCLFSFSPHALVCLPFHSYYNIITSAISSELI